MKKGQCKNGHHNFQITSKKDREGVAIWVCVHCQKKISSM